MLQRRIGSSNASVVGLGTWAMGGWMWGGTDDASSIAAIRASGDRTHSLGAIAMPALVIHGTDDPLIATDGGRATAAALRNATYVELPDVAHGVPDAVWPAVLRHLHRHFRGGAG